MTVSPLLGIAKAMGIVPQFRHHYILEIALFVCCRKEMGNNMAY